MLFSYPSWSKHWMEFTLKSKNLTFTFIFISNSSPLVLITNGDSFNFSFASPTRIIPTNSFNWNCLIAESPLWKECLYILQIWDQLQFKSQVRCPFFCFWKYHFDLFQFNYSTSFTFYELHGFKYTNSILHK